MMGVVLCPIHEPLLCKNTLEMEGCNDHSTFSNATSNQKMMMMMGMMLLPPRLLVGGMLY
jgi:hypothetical protein